MTRNCPVSTRPMGAPSPRAGARGSQSSSHLFSFCCVPSIDGDLFVIYWDSKTRKLYGLNASGRSPLGLTRDVFHQKGLKQIPENGPLSWSVPGCVDGWETLRARFGTRPLAELLQPAIVAA